MRASRGSGRGWRRPKWVASRDGLGTVPYHAEAWREPHPRRSTAGDPQTLLSGDDLLITEDDITSNPKHLKFLKTADNTQLTRQLQDVDAAILQGNAALGVDLSPAKDALQLEDSKNGNPYVNVLIAPKALHDDPRVEALDKALTSKEVADWITKTYKGSVIPVNQVE